MESKYIDLVINRLTQAQYDELKRNNQISEEEIYDITDHDDLFYYKTQLYTKEEIDTLLANFSPVQANPELTGNEEILDSITIDGKNYQVFPEGTIEFSTERSTDESAYTLGSIVVGNDIWNLPKGGSGGSVDADLSDYYNKSQVDTKLSNVKTEILGGASIDFDTLREVENWINDETSGGVALTNQVGQLSSELQLKANTSDVYNKTEIDSMLEGGVGGSSVIANPELDGGEEILESIQIEDIKYTLQGQDMTFSESISTDPDAKILKTITIGTDDWKVDKGSVVVPNVELTGDEEVLESVQIDDNTFTLKGEEMIFSETPVSGANVLRNIELGGENWGIGSAASIDVEYLKFNSSASSIKVSTSIGSSTVTSLYIGSFNINSKAKAIALFGKYIPVINFTSSITDDNTICFTPISGYQNAVAINVLLNASTSSSSLIQLYFKISNGTCKVFSSKQLNTTNSSNYFVPVSSEGFPVLIFK